MSFLSDKIALVTGGSRGIGRAIALRLAAEGADILIHYARNRAAAESVREEIETRGSRAALLQSDLGSLAGVRELVRQLPEQLGGRGLDILVNNAGVLAQAGIGNTVEDQFDHLINVNVKAPYFMIQETLGLLNEGGRIINLSSNLARQPRPAVGLYAMTKAALDNLTAGLAGSLGGRGITINAVAPAATDTDMNAERLKNPAVREALESRFAFRRIGRPDDIAGVVAFLASPDAGWITGQIIEASGGFGLPD
ncbi:SDR family NAD(P)-dependent oxidoreductase [Larkinella soli]|uniref:SDR family NAD(P)-dependent oxidoreductase n=1 Tax=Larkinella soli TaxID=1770527 RepID=UPI000FFC5349|nr:SDR family oxidoreductase [Larkinella soli]